MSTSSILAAREYAPTTWDLSELLPSPSAPEVRARLDELEAAVESFGSLRDELTAGPAPDRLVAALRSYERIVERMHELSGYGMLWFAADTGSELALTYRNQMRDELTRLHNRVLFFTVWWKELDEEAAQRALAAVDELPDFQHYLRDLRRLRPFSLGERAEQVVNLKNANGIDAVLTLYSMLTNRLEFRLEVDGEERILTRDEIQAQVFSTRPEIREAAYREIFRVYEGEAIVAGQIYVNRVRDWHNEHRELRGYPSAIEVRNFANDVPAAAVDTLLGVVSEHAPLFQRYFRLKAGWLGRDKLRRYDLYAPLSAADREVRYAEGVRMVLETFERFHPRLGELAERVFAEDHIDAEIRKGKKSGAFCATITPRLTPWLLVNYTGRVRDVATLAHELGHAVHSLLAAEHPVLTQQPSLPLAETASVFAEMLLTDRLLDEEDDPLVRRELLASAMDDVYATVLRQAYFTRFELAAHDAILAGRRPSELDEIYLSTLVEQFGDAVEVSPEFRREWLMIPHFFQTPFYCYAYSFGQLLVLALYQRYQEEGSAFIPGYLRLLAHGGSARPEAILAEAGVDMTDADFWRGGFRVVERMVAELEAVG